MRTIRLATGLVMFAYVLTHYVNHALGNVSLGAMDEALNGAAWAWGNPVTVRILYAAILTHIGLGLWALYARRPFRYSPGEAAQMLLGFAIPVLLISHVADTRIAAALGAPAKGYGAVVAGLAVLTPGRGVLQAVALLVAWTHGCMGLHYWLRLKPAYPRMAPLLLAGAVLLPVLALLGYWQASRAVAALMADPAWRADTLGVPTPESLAIAARTETVRDVLLAGFVALVLATLVARLVRRLLERRRGLIRIAYPDGRIVRVPGGTSVLEASRLGRIPHAGVCGGRGRCSTCRIRLVGRPGSLPAPSPAEKAVLDRIGAVDGIRLACQLRPRADLAVAPLLPPGTGVPDLGALEATAFGEERFVVAMFVDMRNSTGLAETHLPFDTVFHINRFLEAVGGAVAEAGGTPNQFLGDGLLALFGIASDARAAARGALRAVGLIADRIEQLNAALAVELREPVRFGIGVHGGTAVLGEIGDRTNGRAVFTAIGDPVNVASRLQGLTKQLGCEAIVSDAVFETAGAAPGLPGHEVDVEGRQGRIRVRALSEASLAGSEPLPAPA